MINIIRKESIISDTSNYITVNDDDFDGFVSANVACLSFMEEEESVLKEIDGAIILDKLKNSIETKFGVTDLDHLSMGCKIVLTYMYIYKHKDEYINDKIFLDVTECGSNALNVLFKIMTKYNDNTTVLLLRHIDGISACKGFDFYIDMRYRSDRL